VSPVAFRPAAATDVARMRARLDELFERASAVDDREVRADLCQLICVRLAGFVEQACLSLGRSVSERLSHVQARSFALSHLQRAPNPSAEKLETLVARFDVPLKERLSELLSRDERRARLNALVGIRNQIAHGVNQTTGLETAREYRTLCDEVVDLLVSGLEPTPTAVT
jgi:hypothetical protein